MAKDSDAYGRQMLAQYHSKRVTAEIIEREDGYIATGSDPGLYFCEYKQWSLPERRAIAYAINMRALLPMLMLILCVVSPAAPWSRNQSPAQSTDKASREEQIKKIREECEEPGWGKPETDLKAKMSLLCGKAISLPKPAFPEEAKAAKATGIVAVDIVIDEEGRVVWAKAIEGHELLQQVSVRAACQARFSPMKISGRAVKASGVITYNFVKE